jgi:hypothetical protein
MFFGITTCEINVTLKIKDSEYEISFPPTLEGARKMTVQFCNEKGKFFGIDATTFDTACLKPVGDFLADKVKSFINQKENERKSANEITDPPGNNGDKVNVDLNIGGTVYRLLITVEPPEDLSAAASRFCLGHLTELRITQAELPRCVSPVLEQLEHVADEVKVKRRKELEGKKQLKREHARAKRDL